MGAGAGGVKFQGRYGFVIEAGIEQLTPDCRAILVGFSLHGTREWPAFQGSMFEPTEARQLAAALNALADEIDPPATPPPSPEAIAAFGKAARQLGKPQEQP